MVMLWLLLACGPEVVTINHVVLEESAGSTDDAEDEPAPVVNPLAPLARVSLDLRGVRPTAEEIAEFEAGQDDLGGFADRFMADPRFHDQVMALYSEVFRMPSTRITVPFTAFDVSHEERPIYLQSIGEEPLRVLAHIASEDLPLTDLVTGDWTMANEMLGRIWPVDYPDDASGWQVAHYTDGRPRAGLLSANSLWWRFGSTISNLNRGRANQISRIFLCHDHLSMAIAFDPDIPLFDDASVAEAVATEPACLGCHLSLDPIASYLFGFWYLQEESGRDAAVYHPEREPLGTDMLGTAPSFYGTPGESLTDLGTQLAADPRFASCAVEHAFTRLMRREPSIDDTDALTVHREALLEGGVRLRPLFRSIVTHPRYQPLTYSSEPLAQGAVPRKMVTADQLASQVEALTGFVWTSDGHEMLQTDEVGLGNLAGRADGERMRRHATMPNPTLVLVQERLAEAAALHLVAAEVAVSREDRMLFRQHGPEDAVQADPDKAAAQIQSLVLLVLSRRVAVDGEEVVSLLELWDKLYGIDEDTEAAWAGLLAVLLRDPDFLFY